MCGTKIGDIVNNDSNNIQERIANAIENSRDGTLDDKQLEEVRQLLLTNPEARQAYLHQNQLSQMLCSDISTSHLSETTKPVQANVSKSWLRMIVVASLLIAVLGTISYFNMKENKVKQNIPLPQHVVAIQSAIRPASSDAPVAVLTETTAANWKNNLLAGASAVPLRAGWLNLIEGSAVIRFNSGAMVTLTGPARFRLLNEKHGYLESGKLVASVNDDAIGFRIDSPTMQLTDLGTEFVVDATTTGATDVYVLKGLVRVQHKDGIKKNPQRLKLFENESSRFIKSGVPEHIAFNKDLSDKLVTNRPSQQIGIYTFDTSGSGSDQDPYVTNPSANVVAGSDIRFHDFRYKGVVPGPAEFPRNLNRWSFKSWRPNYQVKRFYVGFKVEAKEKQLLQLNKLTLELFRAGGENEFVQAPQNGVLRVSSDRFKSFTRFILMDEETFVNQAKFITIDLSQIPPASHYDFRFLFKGETKALQRRNKSSCHSSRRSNS